MNKLAAVILGAAMLAGCTSHQQVQDIPPIEAAHEDVKIVPVDYLPLELNKAAFAPIKANDINAILKQITFEDVSVSLYSKVNQEQYIFVSVQTSSEHLEISGPIGYGSDPSWITVSQIDFNGIPLIKIDGFVGASAPLTEYVQIVDNTPVSFLEIESYVEEYDADLDGMKELIAAAGGTIPDTSVIKADNGQYTRVNLNERTGGSVSYDRQANRFNVYYGADKKPEQYKLTSTGLEFVGELNMS